MPLVPVEILNSRGRVEIFSAQPQRIKDGLTLGASFHCAGLAGPTSAAGSNGAFGRRQAFGFSLGRSLDSRFVDGSVAAGAAAENDPRSKNEQSDEASFVFHEILIHVWTLPKQRPHMCSV